MDEPYPISSTLNSDIAPIGFEIKEQGDKYLHLSQSYLQISVNLLKLAEGIHWK